MEKPPSLLCPECGTLFDLKETFPDCEHLYCASCFLKTNNRTCNVCELHKADRCGCAKYGTIKSNLIELESEMEYEKDDFIKEQIKKIQERCSNCSKPSETSMFCIKCAWTMFRKLENEEWVIYEVEGNSKLINDVICAECAVTDHEGHELVEVAGIPNLTDAIKNEFFLEYYHHRKPILQLFSSNIEKYKKRADYFYEEVNKRNHEKWFLTCSTKVNECFREERKKLTDLMLKVLKLILRLKMMYIDCLDKHINHQADLYEKTATDEQKEVIQRLLIRLNNSRVKFKNFMENYSQVQLTPGDIQEIDAELDARMETLETKYTKGLMKGIELETGPKFHKYQAILREATRINNRFKRLSSEEDEESDAVRFIERCQKRISFISGNYYDQEKNPEEAIKFYEIEIMQSRIWLDKEEMKSVETNERLFFVELMKLKFFPITPEADAMDAVYHRFFQL